MKRRIPIPKHKIRWQSIVDLSLHFFFTAVCAVFVYAKTQNFKYVAVFILAGIFVDLDHVIDYCLYYGRRVQVLAFLNSRYLLSGKIYVFLHSWEIVGMLFLSYHITGMPWLWWCFLGLSLHLTIDTIARANPWFYFFTYRLVNRFDAMVILPGYRRIMSEVDPALLAQERKSSKE